MTLTLVFLTTVFVAQIHAAVIQRNNGPHPPYLLRRYLPMEEQQNRAVYATCRLEPNSGTEPTEKLSGTIHLLQRAGKRTRITGEISGFSGAPGSLHGFHIHESADPDNNCNNNGGHYNPNGREHAGPRDKYRHVGDLGNVEVCDVTAPGDVTHRAKFRAIDREVELRGHRSVIGKSFVVHADRDDLGRGGFPDSKTTGHAGARLACCKIVRQEFLPAEIPEPKCPEPTKIRKNLGHYILELAANFLG